MSRWVFPPVSYITLISPMEAPGAPEGNLPLLEISQFTNQDAKIDRFGGVKVIFVHEGLG